MSRRAGCTTRGTKLAGVGRVRVVTSEQLLLIGEERNIYGIRQRRASRQGLAGMVMGRQGRQAVQYQPSFYHVQGCSLIRKFD